jgi:STE24 endopeptidase
MSDAMATRMLGVIVYSVLKRLRLPVSIVAALVVAEAAVVLMRPRDGLSPVDAAPQTYFSTAFIERAEDFRTGQLLLYGARLAIEIGLLVYVVRRPPARLRARFRRPVLAGAATAAALAVTVTLVTLPVSAVSRERAKDVGLVTQSWTGWLGDVAKGIAIEAVIVGAGGALLVFLMRRLGRHWWAPAAAIAVGFAVVVTYASPIVLDPMFNRFEPLPAGDLRRDVIEMAERAGVKVGEVYEMDASRRTTAANAYVAGLGATKRVVLYDTLLRDFSPEEVRLVVAHELGHVHYDDVPRGLLYVAIVAPFGMFAVARLAERWAPGGGPAAVPAVGLALALIVPAVTMISNQLSRPVEARADRYSIRLTGEVEGLIGFQQRIVEQNVSDPDPPAWVHFLLGTHPTAMDRIGQALALMPPDRAAGGEEPPGGS